MTTTLTISNDIEVLRSSARMTRQVIKLNLEGVTHQDSLVQPSPGGNCLNWVLGHLLWVYDQALPLVKEQPVLEESTLNRYARGSAPLQNPSEAIQFDVLVKALDKATERIDAGLANLTTTELDARAPFSPNNDPNETLRSLLSTVSFHQAYHAGQTGVLRRLIGKPGAIA